MLSKNYHFYIFLGFVALRHQIQNYGVYYPEKFNEKPFVC